MRTGHGRGRQAGTRLAADLALMLIACRPLQGPPGTCTSAVALPPWCAIAAPGSADNPGINPRHLPSGSLVALVYAPPRSHSTRHLPDASSCQEGHQHARYHACLPWEPREAPVAMCLPRMDMDTASPVALTTPVLRLRPARTSWPHVAMSEAQQHTHGRRNDHTGTRCATSHARPYVLICRPPPQLGTSEVIGHVSATFHL